MRIPTRELAVCWALGLLGSSVGAVPQSAPAEEREHASELDELFLEGVHSILEKECLRCHGPRRAKSGLRLDSRAALLEGGERGSAIDLKAPARSLLLRAVSYEDVDLEMPPKGRLSDRAIESLRRWLEAEAPWPESDHRGPDLRLESEPTVERKRPGSLEPIGSSAPPAVSDPAWTRNAIDAFILARLEEADLEPSPEADRRTLIRRLTLDLWGLPPTIERVAAFLEDSRPDAFERLVDELLASPHYGERWGRHWLDVVRFAETHGFEVNTPRTNAWPYRDYVIESFNEDTSYFDFVFEQVAGDVRGLDAATGFLVAGSWDAVKSPDIELTKNQRDAELHDMVSTTASTFLGLTVGCAKCHDHKFDPVSQKDYYGLRAFFAGVQHGDRTWRSRDHEARQTEARQIDDTLASLREWSDRFHPWPALDTLLLDDTGSQSVGRHVAEVQALVEPSGRSGTTELSASASLPNLGESYTYWAKRVDTDLMEWSPRVSGRYRIWLSWGTGHASHAKDASYWLDRDGDLITRSDQTLLAEVDQRFGEGQPGETPERSQWSGLLFAGAHALTDSSRIVLRSGETEAPVTADLLVLQREDSAPEERPSPAAPRLRSAVDGARNVERIPAVRARRVRFTVTRTNSVEPCIDELEIYASGTDRNVALAATGAVPRASSEYPSSDIHKIVHVNDGIHGNSRSWISNEVGGGWVEIELPETTSIDRIVWGRDRERRFADRLALGYRIEVQVDGGAWQVVSSSDDRLPWRSGGSGRGIFSSAGLSEEDLAEARLTQELIERLEQRRAGLQPDRLVYAGTFVERPPTTHRLHRGDPMQEREPIAPRTLAVLPARVELDESASEQERRAALAEWLCDPENPLVARVAVNRLWHYHFGRGLVATPSDFGFMGTEPSHPELLDWLARALLEQSGSLKALHRLIVLSSTYRQAGQPNDAGLANDADCRLLWRYPPRRLEAEAIRDSILAVSGQLDLTRGGPGFSAFEPNENYVRVYQAKERFGPEDWRRMVYQTKVRMEQDATFGAFDCPDGAQICPTRSRSTTPLQAFNLLNSPFVIEQAGFLADRIREDVGRRFDDQARRGFELTFSRPPTETELGGAVKLIEEHGLPLFCRALFNANEFVFLP